MGVFGAFGVLGGLTKGCLPSCQAPWSWPQLRSRSLLHPDLITPPPKRAIPPGSLKRDHRAPWEVSFITTGSWEDRHFPVRAQHSITDLLPQKETPGFWEERSDMSHHTCVSKPPPHRPPRSPVSNFSFTRTLCWRASSLTYCSTGAWSKACQQRRRREKVEAELGSAWSPSQSCSFETSPLFFSPTKTWLLAAVWYINGGKRGRRLNFYLF